MKTINYNTLKNKINLYKKSKNKLLLEEIIYMHSNFINEIIQNPKYKELENDEKLSCIVLAIIETVEFFNLQLDLEEYKKQLKRACKKFLYNEIKKIKIDSNFDSYEYYASQHKNGEENSITQDMCDEYIMKEKINSLYQDIQNLSEIQKFIITARYITQMTYKEISNTLKVNINIVKNEESKAIKKLKHPKYSNESHSLYKK